MSITKSIGKNTLGGGGKMNVDLRTYNRSTHNLSYAWRSTMGIGTLVPFMCEVALPGDTWDIQLDQKVLTIPTIGPLFGSYKLQMDVFTCPIRLYNAMLHNNMLNIGLKMSDVKLPQIAMDIRDSVLPNPKNKWPQVHPSSLLAYLGIRGFSGKRERVQKNAVPLLAYFDIFKNYYANKQEDIFYTIGTTGYIQTTNDTQGTVGGDPFGLCNSGSVEFKGLTSNKFSSTKFICYKGDGTEARVTLTADEIEKYYDVSATSTLQLKLTIKTSVISKYGTIIHAINNTIATLTWNLLTEIDDIREDILSKGKGQYTILGGQDNLTSGNEGNTFLEALLSYDSFGYLKTSYQGAGLAIKTHQSDIFNNWMESDWIDGVNGIAEITKIDTSGGSFSIDTLNLSQKVYDMLNRIAISGGSYRDWIETVYTNNWTIHTETPVYQGGMSAEIVFDEVVSTNTGSDEALGTLAGKGKDTNKKGGRLKIKIDEPSYIMGIVSITPRVDYCQGNRWDTALQTLDDLHKPALDGIGFQDLMAWKMAWWVDNNIAIGKQPAWIDYMTNFNRTYGGFAIENDSAFMVLNRYYYPEDDNYQTGNVNYTTYIQPQDFNYTFAYTDANAENFWVQIGCGIECRRVMSAKQIPNL